MGEDPWLGCNGGYRLSEPLVASLKQRSITFLYQLASPVQENRRSQGWHPTYYFDFPVREEAELKEYIRQLQISLVQIREGDDELI